MIPLDQTTGCRRGVVVLRALGRNSRKREQC
jgi:hypothetical protein